MVEVEGVGSRRAFNFRVVPTKCWKQVYPSQAAPGYLQYKLDSSTGKNFAKLFDVPSASKLSRKFRKTTKMAEPSYDGNQSKDENDLKLASENESCKVSHNKIEDLETNSGNPCLSNQSLDRK